jgi:hypothetical protein
MIDPIIRDAIILGRSIVGPDGKRIDPRDVYLDPASDRSLVNKMTNWQRNQWARAGYPPHRKGEFARMVRPFGR